MPNALQDANLWNFSALSPVSMGDLNGDDLIPKGYRPGGIHFLQTPFGAKIVQYIQNRSGSTYAQGALVSSVGDADGKTQITSSGGASVNTIRQVTTSGLVANVHVGAGLYVLNCTTGAGAAPEGEESIIVENSATLIMVDSNLPFSATVASGDTLDIAGFYNSELSADGDLAAVVLGVVIGKDGISNGNFGWVCKHGRCPNTLLKAATALTQNDAVVADAGRVGPAVGTTDPANLHVGYAPHVVNSDIVSDKTTVRLILGLGFNPGTLDASA